MLSPATLVAGVAYVGVLSLLGRGVCQLILSAEFFATFQNKRAPSDASNVDGAHSL
jgi:hypothetical protein